MANREGWKAIEVLSQTLCKPVRYRTDLAIDRDMLMQDNAPVAFFWGVRRDGTDLIPVPVSMIDLAWLGATLGENDWYYYHPTVGARLCPLQRGDVIPFAKTMLR